jgi:hypothetical protein
LSGGTSFNSDLFGAEHLTIEDDVPGTDLRSRRALGSHINNVAVNESQSCHAKGRPAITLTPCWRLTITCNDEPENLLILPPIDDSIADKLILLKGYKHGMPMPTEKVEQREAFWAKLVSEVPAFLDFLEKWEIPSAIRDDRFGVRHFHHPELLAALNDLAPEEELLRLIDERIFSAQGNLNEWTWTALELEEILTSPQETFLGESWVCADRAKRLLSWNNALGTYLGRLRSRYPERIEYVRTATSRMWRIKRSVNSVNNATGTDANATGDGNGSG